MIEMREITVEKVKAQQDKYILVDVREPHELMGPEGCIQGAISAPLGPSFVSFLESAEPTKEYVFICLGGYRSAKACGIAATYGFSKAYNMIGGMVAWNRKQGEH